jgi:Sporulation and spore germination/Immunoglobulin-like domain of bacterial spore germination
MSTRIAAVVCTCLLAAGCGGSGAVVVGSGQKPQPPAIDSIATVSSGSGSAPAPVTSHTPAKMAVEVWLVRGGELWPTIRGVQATRAVIGAAVKQLLAGPSAADARAQVSSAVPGSTQLLGISLHHGVATVDLTSDLQGHGVAAERLALAQLVFTVTQFPSVRGVTLHLDGAPVTALADGLVVPDPIRRTSMGFPALVPPITVTSPLPGTAVQAPFTVRGVADVFEAGLTYRLLDASGHELGSGASSASCGTGCPGTFSFQIPEIGVSHRQAGTLVISAANASGQPGGGRQFRLPLVLVPRFDVARPLPGATLTSPATIAFGAAPQGDVLVRIFDAKLHLLARRVVDTTCQSCSEIAVNTFTEHLPFSVAGLQQGYVVISPLHVNPNASGRVVEIPVALNGG